MPLRRGGALGADYLVTGKVVRLPGSADVPETLSLDLTLLAVRSGERVGAAIETARSDAELVTRVHRAVPRLVAKVLAGRAGNLVVVATESGATVKVDETVLGVTPVRAALPLPAGPHLLVVEKTGFIAYAKEIKVDPGQLTEELVSLLPSADFVREYEARQRRIRTGVWVSGSLAVVGAVSAIALQLDAGKLYGNESSPGTFLYDRRRLQDGTAVEKGKDLRAEASRLKSRIRTQETLSYVSAGVAGVATATAVYLWIVGDDPDRYAAFREPAARLDLAPVRGGAVASLRLTF